LYESEGRYRDAFRCYKMAMEVDPKYARGRERMQLLKDMLWRKTVEDFDGVGAKDPLRMLEDPDGTDDEAPEESDAQAEGDTDEETEASEEREAAEDNDDAESVETA
jgi:predicted HNH restriction endonuclease